MNDIQNKIKILSQIYPYLWSKEWGIRLRFIIGVFFLLTTIILNISVPLVLKKMIDIISHPSSVLFLAELIFILYGLLWALNKVSDQIRFIVMIRVIERGIRLLCLRVFDHLIHLSLRYHSSRKTGAILSLVDRAQFAFPGIIWGLFFLIIPTLIEIIIATLILFYLYGYIYGIILSFILILFIGFSIVGGNWSSEAQRVAIEKSTKASASMVDSLLNYETIQCFGNQQYEYKKCNRLLSEREQATAKQQTRAEIVLLIQGIIMGVGLILLTWLTGVKVLSSELQVSDFVLINGYLLQFMGPLGSFGYVFRDLAKSISDLEGVAKILNEKTEVVDKKDAKILVKLKGNIKFEKVTFGYDPRRLILKGISFEIPAKKTCAIVGSTGSGKSTITKLLFRHYDVLSGQILLDHQDIRDFNQLSLRSVIGIVPQHTALFNDTMRYNIAYGKPDASDIEIKEAIKNAHLDLFISSLPDGMDTLIGENGLKLSGGERQRIAIARVLLKKPAIYIFDEATSSLDTKTEYIIQKNIEEISRNVTTIIIAHRLSTVIHADLIIVLDHGKICEQGTHAELLRNNGLYENLWAKQSNTSHK